jgi:hypothetical protein
MYREFILRKLEEKANLEYPQDKELIAEIDSLKKLLAWLDILEDHLSKNQVVVGKITLNYRLRTLFVNEKPIEFHNLMEGLFKFIYEVSKE